MTEAWSGGRKQEWEKNWCEKRGAAQNVQHLFFVHKTSPALVQYWNKKTTKYTVYNKKKILNYVLDENLFDILLTF